MDQPGVRRLDPPVAGLKTRVLSFHAPYACRSSGACCSSGWPIPVGPDTARRLRAELGSGGLSLPARSRGRAPLADGLLACDEQGRCAFFEDDAGRLCAIQRRLGHEALPAACRHFPRIALVEDGRVSLTLSHYCPSAAALLFEGTAPATIVEDAPGFPAAREYEGLDARGALPPLLRPGVLMSARAYERFERHCVDVLGAGQPRPERGLARIAGQVEALRRWTPAAGDLDSWTELCLERDPVPAAEPATDALWSDVVEAVPHGLAAPVLLPEWQSERERWVAPAWEASGAVVGRYLAARAFASWCAFQGDGLRSTLRALQAALAVLVVECARGCAEAARPLDAALLKQALRRSDRLLAHLVAPNRLARRLSACERAA